MVLSSPHPPRGAASRESAQKEKYIPRALSARVFSLSIVENCLAPQNPADIAALLMG